MNKNFVQLLGVAAVFAIASLFFTNAYVDSTSLLSVPEIKEKYITKVKSAVDFWAKQDFSSFNTGHICKPTSVTKGLKSPNEGKPYITPKIHMLAKLMTDLSKIYPFMDSDYQNKIKTLSTNLYYWFYRQIDWQQSLIADDYGFCYKNSSKIYSHLTTALVVNGFLSLRSILSSSDPIYFKLSKIIESLSVQQLETTDDWMTPVGKPPIQVSANFMALNLLTVSNLNIVNPKNKYIESKLKHRLLTDYTWIRSSFVNYSEEIQCNKPIMFGGWSHQNLDVAIKNLELDPTIDKCSYFNSDNKSPNAIAIRSYYLQKVSYHTFITNGLMASLNTLESRQQCDLVNYGSQGTCTEIKTILKAAATWLYFMINENGSIPSAFNSYETDEFGYFHDNNGTSVGVANLVEILNYIKKIEKRNNPVLHYGFIDQKQNFISFLQMKNKIQRSILFAIDHAPANLVMNLQDSPFVFDFSVND